jgi:7-carboxy-7-deazaguanine synthase
MDLRYTEIFYSIQGEGKNTGRLCTWLRTFSCTLECMGFGQEEPGNPETWQPQYSNEEVIAIKTVKDVPTPKYGCDSAYSWSKQFRHVALKEDTAVIAEKIKALTPNNSFQSKIGHVFTGGEPLMHQRALVEILQHWLDMGDIPAWVCFETNGTVELCEELIDILLTYESFQTEVYFSISPKLLHVAGEQPEKAIKLSVIKDITANFPYSYLKFVLNMDTRAWVQAHDIVRRLNENTALTVPYDVWVMPVGATFEQQDDGQAGKIADIAISHGWNVSPRVHVMLWKNDQIGR